MPILKRPQWYGKTGARNFRYYSGPYPTYQNSQVGAAASLPGSSGAYDVSSMVCCCTDYSPPSPVSCCSDWVDKAHEQVGETHWKLYFTGCDNAIINWDSIGQEWNGSIENCGDDNNPIGVRIICDFDEERMSDNFYIFLECQREPPDFWEGFASEVNCSPDWLPGQDACNVTPPNATFGPIDWGTACTGVDNQLIGGTLECGDGS